MKLYIAQISAHQEVASHFVVMERQLRVAKNGAPYLTLKLGDRTGHIPGRVWERAQQLAESIPPKCVVFVRGRAEQYRDELQLNIQEIQTVPVDQVDRKDFLPATTLDVAELLARLRKLIAGIRKESLQRLMKQIMRDRQLVDRWAAAPAAKSMHHAYLGGLLEHTVSVGELVNHICRFYPELDRDTLVTGALLHDLGKVDEFDYDLFIDYSVAGRLLGHMVLGLQIVDDKLRQVKGFPAEDEMVLKHLILSHHGETELGAVRLPMTREAFVLHFADDLDAKMNSIGRILEEPGEAGHLWTAYQPLFNRFFFRGFPPSDEGLPSPEEVEAPRGVQLNIWQTHPRREE